jgi:hypothetical protein
MKKFAPLVAALLLTVACGGGERPMAASCTPSVKVTVSPAAKRPASKTDTARERPREVVQVYWDISRSMRDFAATGTPRRGTGSNREVWTDDLTPVVAALDSSVLLRAHAKVVEQYGVGETIKPLATARAALKPEAKRTALHLAAEQLGTALANGNAQAALVISDMELDTPPRVTGSAATVCRDIPLPSTAEAGSLFGRCFETAVLNSGGVPLTRSNLLVHVFRKSTHGRELFILLLATDRAFGDRISAELVKRVDFSRHVIFDSGAVAASNVKGCRLTPVGEDVPWRMTKGCGAKCFDRNAAIQAECDLSRPVNGAWILPYGRGVNGATYESQKRKAGDPDEPALVRFRIPCSTPPGPFAAVVSFHWRDRPEGVDAAFAQKASVRDLFDSLTDAIVRTVAPRNINIGIQLE